MTESSSRPTPRVLLVDDERTVLFSLGRFLRIRGYEVDAARDQGEAEGLLDAHSYDVVVTDLRLSGSEGAEGLSIIARARAVRPTATVILLTAYGTQDVLDAAQRLGATAILSKPVALEELLAVLASRFPR